MIPFLKRVAKEIAKLHPEGFREIAIVLPGKRPTIYLRQHLAEEMGKTHWAPTYLTINEFTQECSGMRPLDAPNLLFRSFEVFSKKNKAGFEEYSKWAPGVLREFNDIDHYLLDASLVFSNLESFKEIEGWSFGEDELSEDQQHFNRFWKSLDPLYDQLRADLLASKQGYPGLIARQALRFLQENDPPYKQVYFVGFNALTLCESRIFKLMHDSKRGATFWDTDKHYMEDEMQEAGLFLRRHQSTFTPFNWQEDQIQQKKEINIHSCGTPVGMVKIAGQLLKDADPERLNSTAIILGDESLLIPLLHSLPPQIEALNVTMGIPLSITPIGSLIRMALSCLGKSIVSPVQVSRRNLLKFLEHPWMRTILPSDDIKTLRLSGRHRIDRKWSEENFETTTHQRLHWLWEHENIAGHFTDGLLEIISAFEPTMKSRAVFHESLLEAASLLNRMKLLGESLELLGPTSLTRLWKWMIQHCSLSLRGEPKKGLQILGVLESRALDFERVIILGVNEGILPQKAAAGQIIPFEIRKAFGMPTATEQEAIYAYYFYRLLHQSKSVDLLYSSQSASFQGTEPSRYILQLKEELKNTDVTITPKSWHFPLPGDLSNDFVIEQDDFLNSLIDARLEKGISPSAINTFYRCPLDFYFKYLLNFKEPKKDPDEPDNAVIGSVAHTVIEKLYEDMQGHVLQKADLLKAMDRVPQKCEEELKDNLKIKAISGKNLLALTVIQKFVEGAIQWDLDQIKQGISCELISLERKMPSSVRYEGGRVAEINLIGIADRVDQVENTVRIIDYKTGAVKQSDLHLKTVSDAFKVKKEKALQLLDYAFLSRNDHPGLDIQSGILSLRNISSGLMTLELGSDEGPTFEDCLMSFVDLLYSGDVDWNHNENSDFCHFCE